MSTVVLSSRDDLAKAIERSAETGEALTFQIGNETYTFDPHAKEASESDQAVMFDDIETARAALRDLAGMWDDDYADAFKQYIRERRQTKNRPRVRL